MFKDVNESLRNTIRVMAGRRRSFVLVLLLSYFCLSVGVAECWPDFPLSSDGFAARIGSGKRISLHRFRIF